ncbi:MAG: MFS transporter [Anaerolineae bacterium]
MPDPGDDAALRAEVERNYRWNFMANFMDLALYWFANSFVSGVTILPLYVERASGSRLLVGLVSAISQAGWYIPQLLTANYIERRSRRKPIAVNVGLFSERLPLWLLVASTFLLNPANPWPAMAVFFFGYTWSCLGSGAVAPAWQDLVARVIPADRRGRFFGLSNFMGSALGVGGALLSAYLLAQHPFPWGFAWCFILGAATNLVSWAFLTLVREPALCTTKEPVSLGTYFRRLPSILRKDRNFSAFLLNRVASGLGRMATGFLTVYAVGRWSLPDSVAGTFTMILLLSQTTAYLLLGFVADHKGHKVVLEWGALTAMLTMAFCLVAPSPPWFYLAFLGVGISIAADILSGTMIILEFTGTEDRPTYAGLANTTNGISIALGPLMGGGLATLVGYPALFLVAMAMALAAFTLVRFLVREPREVNGVR